jgi:hypothetical protein
LGLFYIQKVLVTPWRSGKPYETSEDFRWFYQTQGGLEETWEDSFGQMELVSSSCWSA